MKAIGIISEYNPFHNGHLYQVDLLREQQLNNGAIVAVMSPSFTQRGEVAVMDKWTRAKTAIQSGVDLVIELPTIFSVASADAFALGGIGVLSGAAVIGTVAFGSESGDIGALQTIASFLNQIENDEASQALIRQYMREGVGYAAALSKIVEEDLGAEAAELMQQANNILGISYLKAIANLPNEQKLKPLTHLRSGESHLNSATKLRQIMAEHQNEPAALLKSIEGQVPATTAAALAVAAREGRLLLPKDLGTLAYSQIRRSNAEELKQFVGMKDGLAERLIQAAGRLPAATDPTQSIYDRLVQAAKARHLSQARVQRAIAAMVLGITEADMAASIVAGPQYIRVLAFNKTGRYLLKQMSRYATLPVITKASDFREHSDKGEVFRRQYELDLVAGDVRSVLCRDEEPGQDFDTAVWIR